MTVLVGVGQQATKTGNGKSKKRMRGSLHCADHDETVICFGRDDASCCRLGVRAGQKRRQGNGKSDNRRKSNGDPTSGFIVGCLRRLVRRFAAAPGWFGGGGSLRGFGCGTSAGSCLPV